MDAGVTGDGGPLRVAELWRYPVKSLQGERLTPAEAGPEGLDGDRRWALFDRATGFGLTGRRVPDLLFASARLRPGRGRGGGAARRHGHRGRRRPLRLAGPAT